ncbi:helix-turn-helix domain-containing protein [Oscillibacter sp. MSJ-2]|uniref:Helix-turn-helix domain-containing protein n=1 Tax=Dysosmobacter acutus TaxID=2841504 RepID=A0ABS6F6A0_9FIRM|nr:helix-turn-helix transcriptional regulator [Dysosmobacter acutus]MBU5625817.1 helix-turn-helix domain-containing protein [Dysosmobacter acutus]
MDQRKTGGLIAAARKELGLTQRQLAERLSISDRTVSKWERGAGFPDVSLLEPLADALGLSVVEIVRGELNPALASGEVQSRAILQVVECEMRRRFRKLMRQAISAAALALCALMFCRGYALYRAGGDPIDPVKETREHYQSQLQNFLPGDALKGKLIQAEISTQGKSVLLTDPAEIGKLVDLLSQAELGRRDRDLQADDLSKTLFFTYDSGEICYITLPSLGIGYLSVDDPALYFEARIADEPVWEALLPVVQPHFLDTAALS